MREAAASADTLTTGSVRAGVFSSVVIPISGLAASGRWKAVLADIRKTNLRPCKDAAAVSASCTPAGTGLAAAVESARHQRFTAKLNTVNKAVNRQIAYGRDAAIHGGLDHWATPAETLALGIGDCEDFAILKMAALKAAGIPTSSMSLVVLRDTSRDVFHAVLAVNTSQGYFILDNMQDAVIADTARSQYQALYSLSEERSWVHGYRRDTPVASSVSLATVAPGEGPEAWDPLLGQIER